VIPGSLANLLGTGNHDAASRLASIERTESPDQHLALPAGIVPSGLSAPQFPRESCLVKRTQMGTQHGSTAQRWIRRHLSETRSAADRATSALRSGNSRAPLASRIRNCGVHAFELDRAGACRTLTAMRAAPCFQNWASAGNRSQLAAHGRGTYAKSFTASTLFALERPTDTRIVGPGVGNRVRASPATKFTGRTANNSEAGTQQGEIVFARTSRSRASVPGLNLASIFRHSPGRFSGAGSASRIFCKASINWDRPRRFYQQSALRQFPGLARRNASLSHAGRTRRLSARRREFVELVRESATSPPILAV